MDEILKGLTSLREGYGAHSRVSETLDAARELVELGQSSSIAVMKRASKRVGMEFVDEARCRQPVPAGQFGLRDDHVMRTPSSRKR